jgi:hypothetical protein
MRFTVKQRGRHIATFRFIEVRLMETLAAWVPTTPEMEAKLLFGPHIWDFAQAADALGKRTYELRLPPQHSLTPRKEYLEVLDQLASTTGAALRIAALYDVMLPALAVRYQRYVERTDTLMDAPSVRVIEDILRTSQRMIHEADALRSALPALRVQDCESLPRIAALESSVAEIVSDADLSAPQAA